MRSMQLFAAMHTSRGGVLNVQVISLSLSPSGTKVVTLGIHSLKTNTLFAMLEFLHSETQILH